MSPEELSNTLDEDLMKFYKRVIQLEGGENLPYNEEQLLTEILLRMKKKVCSCPKAEDVKA